MRIAARCVGWGSRAGPGSTGTISASPGRTRLPGGGRLVSDEIDLVFDIEAIHEGDLEKTGAIEYYR